MLDQDKIVLMSRLASYEKNEGKKNTAIGHYFRNDYISWQVLKSIICSTIVFLILVVGSVVYNFENFMIDVYKLNLLDYGKDILIKYCIFVGAFAVLTYIICSYKYAKARKGLRAYSRNLAKLSDSYKSNDGGMS